MDPTAEYKAAEKIAEILISKEWMAQIPRQIAGKNHCKKPS